MRGKNIRPSDLVVQYKYSTNMAPITRVGSCLVENVLHKYFFNFMIGKMELHVSPVYSYIPENNKPYYQIVLDFDTKHASKGTCVQEVKLACRILNSFDVEHHVEFTGRGYHVVSHIAFPDVNLDEIRDKAKGNWASLDYVVSFRKLPIARLGTYRNGRSIFPIKRTSMIDNFDELEKLSKKVPGEVIKYAEWDNYFMKYILPQKIAQESGMPVFLAIAMKQLRR